MMLEVISTVCLSVSSHHDRLTRASSHSYLSYDAYVLEKHAPLIEEVEK